MVKRLSEPNADFKLNGNQLLYIMELFNNPLLFALGIVILSTAFLLVYYIIDNVRCKHLPTEEDDEDDNSIEDHLKD